MRRLRRIVAAVAAVGVAFAPAPAEAATSMGSGVTCHGAPTYGSNPTITCTQTAGRYASWVRYYRDPYNRAYCDVYVIYGDAFKWAGGNVTVNTRSFTYAGYQRC